VTPADPATFAERLNRLIATVHPPGRGPYTAIEVVQAVTARGAALSTPYLSQLRSGQRTQPSIDTVSALAEFFGIRREYFTGDDPEYTELLDAELRWLDLARNPSVRHLTTTLLTLAPGVRDDLLAAFPPAAEPSTEEHDLESHTTGTVRQTS
jgi:transcriptional regulator with XRE-family HTH domain